MGTCSCSPLDKCELFPVKPVPKEISLNDFEVDCIVGKGGFGKVK